MGGRHEWLVRQRLAALDRALPKAMDGDVESLHQARVATRRLREALPLVASGASRRKLERPVRRLTRAFGPVRELDVALHMLDELQAAGQATPVAVSTLRAAIDDDRRAFQREMLDRAGEVKLDALHRKVLAAARERDEQTSALRHPAPVESEQVIAAQRRATLRAERLRTAIDHAANLYLPDRLHDVRIAVKKLRYALEGLLYLSGSRAMARVRTLKRAQDLLGRMHDLEVLIARTRAVQGASPSPALSVSAHLDELVRTLETECRQLHSHYIRSRQALLSVCDHVIASARGDGSRRSVA